MIWTIIAMVCTGIAGFHYGRLVGIDAMLHLGQEIYPEFEQRARDFVMKESQKK